MMRVCKLDAQGGMSYPEVENTPMAWYDLLGGFMEAVPLTSALSERHLIGLADEDGIRKELPYNVYSPLLGQQIVGPVLVTHAEPPEFVSLTDDDVAALDDWFGRLIVIGPNTKLDHQH